MELDFLQLEYNSWNKYNSFFTEETQCFAKEGDFVFYCDGYLFLVQSPFKNANLVLQQVFPPSHSIFPIYHIYKLVLALRSFGVEYFTFNGKGTRYQFLYKRLFKAFYSEEPSILKCPNPSDSTHLYYVLRITPVVIEYCEKSISHLSYNLQLL